MTICPYCGQIGGELNSEEESPKKPIPTSTDDVGDDNTFLAVCLIVIIMCAGSVILFLYLKGGFRTLQTVSTTDESETQRFLDAQAAAAERGAKFSQELASKKAALGIN